MAAEKDALRTAVFNALREAKDATSDHFIQAEESLRQENRRLSEEVLGPHGPDAPEENRRRDRLIITVYKAANLKEPMWQGLAGTTDPYVVVSVQTTRDKPQSGRTPYVPDTLNPSWTNAETQKDGFVIPFFPNVVSRAARVDCLLRDHNHILYDENIARTSFLLGELTFRGELETRRVLRLQPQGTLTIGVTWLYAEGASGQHTAELATIRDQLQLVSPELKAAEDAGEADAGAESSAQSNLPKGEYRVLVHANNLGREPSTGILSFGLLLTPSGPRFGTCDRCTSSRLVMLQARTRTTRGC